MDNYNKDKVLEDGTIRLEYKGFVISVSGRLPDWDSQKVAYWKIGDESSKGMRCPPNHRGKPIPKLIANAVSAIERRIAREDRKGS